MTDPAPEAPVHRLRRERSRVSTAFRTKTCAGCASRATSASRSRTRCAKRGIRHAGDTDRGPGRVICGSRSGSARAVEASRALETSGHIASFAAASTAPSRLRLPDRPGCLVEHREAGVRAVVNRVRRSASRPGSRRPSRRASQSAIASPFQAIVIAAFPSIALRVRRDRSSVGP